MRLNEVMFIDNLPTIDLHGYDRDSAVLAVCDFIRDNIMLKNDLVVVIHGNGSGILKNAVHMYLRHHKNVQEYKTFYSNQGATIVSLKF